MSSSLKGRVAGMPPCMPLGLAVTLGVPLVGTLPISGSRLRPEERLMVEVLSQACADFSLAAHGLAAARVRAEARRWIESDAEAWPLAFVRICRHFGIDPGAARAAVLRRAHASRLPDQVFARCS